MKEAKNGVEFSESTELVKSSTETVAIATREEGEIKALIYLAKQFPRDENLAVTKMLRSAERAAFAEKASYSFPRGGSTISGPSVNLAREMARCWGNIRYGIRIVSETEEQIHVKGYAYDAETNAYAEYEAKFKNKIYRKAQGLITPDERDKRELINKQGALCVRGALLSLMPPDVVEDMLDRCRDTLRKAANGELKADRQRVIRAVCKRFSDHGVTIPMLETYLGHPIDQLTGDEKAGLAEIYNAINEGNAKPYEYFGAASPSDPVSTAAAPAPVPERRGRKPKEEEIAPKTPEEQAADDIDIDFEWKGVAPK